jgi:hypothetical protein
VEKAVPVAQRWIVAALRNRKYFSLEESNLVIRERVDKMNHTPFRKPSAVPLVSIHWGLILICEATERFQLPRPAQSQDPNS